MSPTPAPSNAPKGLAHLLSWAAHPNTPLAGAIGLALFGAGLVGLDFVAPRDDADSFPLRIVMSVGAAFIAPVAAALGALAMKRLFGADPDLGADS